MTESAVFGITKLITAAVSAVMTSPMGGLDIPEGDFNTIIAHRAPGYQAVISWPDGGAAGSFRSRGPIPVDLDRLPKHFLDAVKAAEDRRFGIHGGVDPVGTLSAGLDVLRGNFRGGSSITQQMVKNTALGAERTMDRKIVEAILATRAQKVLGPDRVLEVYLENAWFGRGQTGVMLAPQAWFGKGWDEVTVAESALLAALLKGPAWFDPVRFPDRAEERRNYVIEGMHATGWIDAATRDAALAEPIRVIPWTPVRTELGWAASLADFVITRDELMRPVPPDMSDVEIVTTIEPAWQDIAVSALQSAIRDLSPMRAAGRIEADLAGQLLSGDAGRRAEAVRAAVAAAPLGAGGERIVVTSLGERPRGAMLSAAGEVSGVDLSLKLRDYKPAVGDILVANGEKDGVWSVIGVPEVQGAIVIMDPRSGNVIASVGGFDERISSFDRTRALRQPGSAIKPFLFLAALNNGFPADAWVSNTRKTYIDTNGASWSPRNYDRSESQGMPLYQGLERSSNLVAADLIDQIGPEAMAEVAEAAGVYTHGGMRRLLSSSLGASETRLIDLVAGYAAIMNDGAPRRPQGIVSISAGEPIPLPPARSGSGVIAGRGAIEDIIAMMRGTILRGTASDAFRGHPVTIVGKTGTTQDERDAWFVGITPHLAIGIWLGKDDNTPLPGNMTGGRNAAPIAAAILREAHAQGMIDDHGLRDKIMSSGLIWPPAPIGSDPVTAAITGDEDDNFILETNEYFEADIVEPQSAEAGLGEDASQGDSGYFDEQPSGIW